jgi:hypothetical protein
MADDSLKHIEARLTRIEAALSGGAGGGATMPALNFIADPGPYGPYGGGGWRPHWPGPIVDKAAYARWPTAVVDPGPDPWGGGWGGGHTAMPFARIGHIGDPPGPDFSRFSISQLEGSLHSIHAERARLDSMETMIKQQLETLKKQG